MKTREVNAYKLPICKPWKEMHWLFPLACDHCIPPYLLLQQYPKIVLPLGTRTCFSLKTKTNRLDAQGTNYAIERDTMRGLHKMTSRLP